MSPRKTHALLALAEVLSGELFVGRKTATETAAVTASRKNPPLLDVGFVAVRVAGGSGGHFRGRRLLALVDGRRERGRNHDGEKHKLQAGENWHFSVALDSRVVE